MSEAPELTEIEAITRVIAEGRAMDYVDVVDAVEKQFRIKTSSATVEKVHRDMMKARADAKQKPKPRVNFELTSSLTDDPGSQPATSTVSPAGEGPGELGRCEPSADALALALQFVKAVGGLKKAKRALQDLEAVLRD